MPGRLAPPVAQPGAARTGLILVLALGLASGAAGLALISVEEEIAIGRQAQAEVRARTPELADAAIADYVRDIGRQLAGVARGPRYPYSFSIADYREINAFALPGGPVWIHRGALDAAGNEAQLAGVLAHEIAHVAERHAAGQLTKALVAEGLLGLLGAVLGDGGAARAAQVAARVAAGGYMLKFSRDDEREADRVGAAIMRRAGWDPRGMIEFLQVIRDQQGRDPSRVEVFLSTHPSPADRIRDLERSVGRGGGRRDSARFREIQRRLARLPPARAMPRR
ncbi:MAG TPA: M48 family metallopeptidase [Vicinamibacterales bacterium]|nr:M48 family metallopeptidase [Vicinamibacterales bacterium]